MEFPAKVDVKVCSPPLPPHPCDPPPPCDPRREPDSDCPKPYLCYERLKNPEEDHKTRCQPGSSIGVRTCFPPRKPHPCDPLPPCNALPKLKKDLCDEPPLCREKIKNLEIPPGRRVRCTDSKGKTQEVKIMRD